MSQDIGGHLFTGPPGALQGSVAPQTVAHDERKRLLDERVRLNIINGGARVESRGDYEAVLVRGHRPNHVLHLLLTVVTLGFWAIVWTLIALTTRERRALLTVDEHGRVELQPLVR